MIAALPQQGIGKLNKKYNDLTVYERVERLYQDFNEEDIMITSAFAATFIRVLKKYLKNIHIPFRF